ncbi:hypothetical protein FRC01_010264, partial [Tulasnella sp. 417]
RWLEKWGNRICSSPHRFSDSIVNLPVEQRQHALVQLKKSVKPLVDLVLPSAENTRQAQDNSRRLTRMDPANKQKGLLLQLQIMYEAPGELREGGPRHQNDHASIQDIRIVPSHSELVSTAHSYLPGNVTGAPHHLPSESMERLLDIQFRLLREELMYVGYVYCLDSSDTSNSAPIRNSVGAILDDLSKPPNAQTQLNDLVEQNGGMYETDQDRDSIRSACTPTSNSDRCVKRKRLMMGGLVALIWKTNGASPRVYLGVITSFFDDLLESAKQHENRVKIRVSFFDAEVELRILRRLQKSRKEERETKFLVESPGMFEAVRPFLETLKAKEPTSFPFSDYLPLFDSGDLSGIEVAPPAYAHPHFDFNLRMLFDEPRDLYLRPHDAYSVARARTILKRESRLDDTQAEAMVDALTSEVSLIQGPPGTGKSFTGIEILRVLIANKIGPILLIALTNHALDHIIVKVLEKNITQQIVRLGSRSADATVAELSLDNIVKSISRTHKDRAQGKAFAAMKRTEEAMEAFMDEVVGEKSRPAQFETYLSSHYPLHDEELHHPPFWIQELFDESQYQDDERPDRPTQSKSLVDFWREGSDLTFITYTTPEAAPEGSPAQAVGRSRRRGRNRGAAGLVTSTNDANATPILDRTTWRTDRETFFEETCGSRAIPPSPTTNRSINQLLQDPMIWNMSKAERDRLNAYLNQAMLEAAWQEQPAEFERLKQRHHEATVEWKEIQEKVWSSPIPWCVTRKNAKVS